VPSALHADGVIKKDRSSRNSFQTRLAISRIQETPRATPGQELLMEFAFHLRAITAMDGVEDSDGYLSCAEFR
jgi:hypothetical protein